MDMNYIGLAAPEIKRLSNGTMLRDKELLSAW